MQVALIITFASPALAASCSGNACGEVELLKDRSCVWDQNRSSKPIDIEANLAGGSLKISLQGAKAAETSRQSSGEQRKEAERKQRKEAERCENFLKTLEASRNLGVLPKEVAKCRELVAAASTLENELTNVVSYTAIYYGTTWRPEKMKGGNAQATPALIC